MKKIFANLKRNFFAGLLIILPITLTIIILHFLYDLIIVSATNMIRPLIFFISPEEVDEVLRRYPYLWGVFSLLFLIFGIAMIGVVARSSIITHWLIGGSERLLARVPLISKIYSTIQQISQAILGGKKSSFSRAVLFEYPRKEIWCIGLVSDETAAGEVQKKTENKMISIFLPTTPNPTSGFYILVPEKDTVPLEMSIDEALTMIVSVGVIAPPFEDNKEQGSVTQSKTLHKKKQRTAAKDKGDLNNAHHRREGQSNQGLPFPQ